MEVVGEKKPCGARRRVTDDAWRAARGCLTAEHETHAEAPVTLPNLPESHWTQMVALTTVDERPSSHFTQAGAGRACGQRCFSSTTPALRRVHEAPTVPEKVPAGQSRHCVRPVSLVERPTSQARHAVSPSTRVYLPVAHTAHAAHEHADTKQQHARTKAGGCAVVSLGATLLARRARDRAVYGRVGSAAALRALRARRGAG
jgi:hypothetical protein